MRVKWTEYMPLSRIPEAYWDQDLTVLDSNYIGDVIGTTRSFWGESFLIVACTDGNIREVNINNVKIVKEP
jgi:hypothetical protein